MYLRLVLTLLFLMASFSIRPRQMDPVDRANSGRGGMRGGGFTPPESPRAGAMRAGSPLSFARRASAGQMGE